MNGALKLTVLLAGIFVLLPGLAACGGKGKAVPGPLEVTATASPEEIDLDGSVQLKATLTGTNASAASITWTAEPAVGSFSAASAADTVWTAPGNVDGEVVFTVTASTAGETVEETHAVIIDACLGVSGNCYPIRTVRELQAMQDDLTGHYIVVNDIDASETRDWSSGTSIPTYGFVPVGSKAEPFMGTFSGRNRTIDGLYSGRPLSDNNGLFGYAGGDALIEDTVLTGATIEAGAQANGSFTGALVGYLDRGIVRNASSSGNVTGKYYVGGLIGAAVPEVTWTAGPGGIPLPTPAAGAVGQPFVEHSRSSATVTGEAATGGLIGLAAALPEEGGNLISDSGATGEVRGGQVAGGLLGLAATLGNGPDYAFIVDGSASGIVRGSFSVGGLIGSVINMSVLTSRASGSVEATGDNAGGLLGSGELVLIDDSHASGDVQADGYAGGLAGQINAGFVRGSHATGNVTGSGTSAGGLIGHLYEGQITDSWAGGNVQTRGSNYAGGLVGYAHQVDFENTFSTGIVDAGTGGYAGGLIGRAVQGSNVDLSYSTATVLGGLRIGGLVGSFTGREIARSFSSGKVEGEEETGGLVGALSENGRIADSWSTAEVSGERFTGGLVGYNSGTITTSFSAGRVSGTTTTGGLVGRNAGGNAGAWDSFWDLDTSEQASSQAGIGRTTAEMMTRVTYGNEWDFDGTWAITEGMGYPHLVENPEP